jgi:hypothetical protein
MDYNRWNGTRENVLAYFGRPAEPEGTLCPLDAKPYPRGTAAKHKTDNLNKMEDEHGSV